jgi:hypothetical protein
MRNNLSLLNIEIKFQKLGLIDRGGSGALIGVRPTNCQLVKEVGLDRQKKEPSPLSCCVVDTERDSLSKDFTSTVTGLTSQA